MSAVIDMCGQRFEKLLVISRSEKRGGLARWVCQCDCGNTAEVVGNNLRQGLSKSCGCARVKHGQARAAANTPEYGCWRAMIARCTNPNMPNFKYYGARGISVCDRWSTFENFYADMGSRPSPKHSIERLENDGNYSPSNCVWATKSQQNKNRRKLPKPAEARP